MNIQITKLLLFIGVFSIFGLLQISCTQKQIDPAYIQELETHRQEYIKSFVMNDRSPLTENQTPFLRFFSPKPDYKFSAKYVRAIDEKPFEMLTYSGMKKNFIKHGELHFTINDIDYQLSTYKNLQYINLPIYKDVLFVPFKDETNGDKSYGGGRYLDLKISDITEGFIPLDFNKAYNPWCAYSDGYNCPIPPITNHLEIEIKAGEKNYEGPHMQRPK